MKLLCKIMTLICDKYRIESHWKIIIKFAKKFRAHPAQAILLLEGLTITLKFSGILLLTYIANLGLLLAVLLFTFGTQHLIALQMVMETIDLGKLR
jgi:hypothetical protein